MKPKETKPTRERYITKKCKKCQYPKCNKVATHSLGMADPDAEKYYYCEEHCDKVKMNTLMEIYKR